MARHYYQGGYDLQFVSPVSGQHECAICLLVQREPQQTACGHRFCRGCLLSWLTEQSTCPDCNTALTLADTFPDTIANREIHQLVVR